ncbi:MAG TPA: S-layer homology domain-containing protein [Blastocatellia bacterium]|nr:S-layer homology domain-containing protein [Blastocatellia bacterium]
MKHRLMIITLTILVTGFLCTFQLGGVSAAPGDLDSTFAGSGKSRIGFISASDSANGAAEQPDGKLVVVGFAVNGGSVDFLVIRYNLDGSLDTSFDEDGKVLTPVGLGNAVANAVAIQPDGKIVVAGHCSGEGTGIDYAVVRYNTDGSLDPFFGIGGKQVTSFSQFSDQAFSVAIQADGKIVVAGTADTGSTRKIGVVRYTTGGAPDITFGGNQGRQIISVGTGLDGGRAVAIQADGKIVVAGFTTVSGSNLDFAVVRLTSGGSLDSSFGNLGKATTNFLSGQISRSDQGTSVAIQPDGKIVVAGFSSNSTTTDFAVARYNTNGLPDTLFGGGTGQVITTVGTGFNAANSVMITGGAFVQRIVVAGYAVNGSRTDFALVRYNLDGSLDPLFGGGTGKVITPVGPNNSGISAVTRQAGLIVAAGAAFNGPLSDSAVVRYNSDGSLNSAFDGDGIRIDDFGLRPAAARSMAVQPDGKTVVAGFSENRFNPDFAVARYNPDGSLDTSFDGDGTVTIDINSGREEGNAMALQPDGKIVIVGYRRDASAQALDFAVVRYNTNGTPDTSFNGTGKVVTSVGSDDDEARAVAIQPDGKIIVAGYVQVGPDDNDFVVVRYNTTGLIDSSFNNGGRIVTPFGPGKDEIAAIAIQADGKIVVAGTSDNGSNRDFAVARYTSAGSPDTSFGLFGKQITQIGPGHDEASGMAIQADGKIVVVGHSTNGSDLDIAVVRYTASGSPDNSFDGDGIVTTPIGLGDDQGAAVAIQSDGKIVVAGSSIINSDVDFAIVRYNTNGSPDSSYGSGGKMVVDISGLNDIGQAIAIDPIGRVVVAGTANGLFGVIRVSGDICLSLARASQTFTASGGEGSLNVSAACDWTATSNAPWITVTSGGGSSDGTVEYMVAANNNTASRSGTITIGGQTFTVLQGAAFLDVPPTHPFYTEISKLSARGVTTGCGGGNYCPELPVTREQMAAFIIRAIGEFNPPVPPSQRFADVPPENPFYSFIDRMAVLGITQGCGGGNYCPSQPVLREQMAAFIIRALGEFDPPLPAQQRFNDVPPSSTFYKFIDRMAVRGITSGCSASPPLYCPTDQVTRAQMAAFLVRAFGL